MKIKRCKSNAKSHFKKNYKVKSQKWRGNMKTSNNKPYCKPPRLSWDNVEQNCRKNLWSWLKSIELSINLCLRKMPSWRNKFNRKKNNWKERIKSFTKARKMSNRNARNLIVCKRRLRCTKSNFKRFISNLKIPKVLCKLNNDWSSLWRTSYKNVIEKKNLE